MSPRPPVSLWPDPDALGTLTDLYELTMMAGYHAAGMAGKRRRSRCSCGRCPPGRAFLVFAGLEQAIGDLLRLAFDHEQIDEIRRWPAFRHVDPAVMDKLAATRFEGDVFAVPEGTVVFRGRDAVASRGPAAAGSVGRNPFAGFARLSDPGRFQGRAGRRGGRRTPALRVRRPPRPRTTRRLAGGTIGHDRRLRGHQSRRGRPPPRQCRPSAPWHTRGFNRSRPRPKLSRRSPGFFPGIPRCWSTPTTRSRAFAWPLRSSRPFKRFESTAAIWVHWPTRPARSSTSTADRA